MADHPALTPAEIARAAEVFQSTGSYTDAAREIGRDRTAVMRGLKKASADHVRARVYARTLDAVLAEGVSLQRKALRTLRLDVTASDPKIAHSAIATLNDTVRAVGTARTAHAKLVGEHAAEKHEVTVDSVEEIARRIARLADADSEVEGASGTH